MISQLLSPSNTPTVSGHGEAAAPPKGADGETQGTFSRLLSMLGAAAQGSQDKEIPGEANEAASGGEEQEAPVAALPDLAGTGKILPADAGTLPDAAANPVSADAALAALALVPPQTALPGASVPAAKPAQPAPSAPAPQMPAAFPFAAQADAEGAGPAPQPSVAIQVAPLPGSGEGGAAPRDAVARSEKPATDFAAKLQPGVAGEDARDPAAGGRPAAEAGAKLAGKIAAEPAQVQTPAPAQPPLAAAAGAPAAATEAAPSVAADKPGVETGIARELSRIVDSLATAREAMTAKGATLALDHAEFGELSLRFDQRRDGQLGVQISAADPDAHRAVAAAVADRPAFAQADANQQNAPGGGNASTRGTLADRDGGSGEGSAARHERHEERRRADTETNHSAGKGPGGDSAAIYA